VAHEAAQRTLIYLQQHQVMTLATVGSKGVWAAAVFYVNDDFDLIFLSAGHTRHAQNMATTPTAAGTIQGDSADWTAVQGIQLEGEIKQLRGGARQNAIKQYQAKYTFLAQAPPLIQAAFEKVNWYRLRPSLLYFIDNSQGFGHRDQII
jgi:uncharacterized protein YhbP (UPF0306 family)